MERFCSNCGEELPEAGSFCPACGMRREITSNASVQVCPGPEQPMRPTPSDTEPLQETLPVGSAVPQDSTAEFVVPAEPAARKRKRVKWWMIAIPIILVLAIAVALVWEPLYVRMFPEQILAKALVTTGQELAARSAGNPLQMIAKATGDSRQASVEMVIDFSIIDEIAMTFEVDGQFDEEQMQFLADMHISSEQPYSGASVSMDVGVYLDRDFMALQMDQLTGERYLGIVYDTVGEDFRSSPMLSQSMDEDSISALEEMCKTLSETLSLERPAYTVGDTYSAALMDFIQNLDKPAVENTKVKLGGKEYGAYNICYSIPASDISDLFDKFADELEKDEALRQYFEGLYSKLSPGEWDRFIQSIQESTEELKEAELSVDIQFTVIEDQLILIELVVNGVTEDGEAFEHLVTVDFGTDPRKEETVLTYVDSDGGESIISVSSENTENSIAQTFVLEMKEAGEKNKLTAGYVWDRSSGNLELSLVTKGKGMVRVNFKTELLLKEEEEGFTVELDDIESLIQDSDIADEIGECSLHYTIRPGSDISTPEFTNLKDLTQEDFYDMLMKLYESFG